MNLAPASARPIGAAIGSKWSWVDLPPGSDRERLDAVPPSTTIRRAAPLMDRIGVTRVAEVTRLDRNGIPNFTAVRPREPGEGISYYNGKGAARSQARAGAMMEGIERFSGERCDLPVVVASFEELSRDHPAIDPTELVVTLACDVHRGTPLEWVRGQDLLGGRLTYVPLNAVVCPYQPRHAVGPFYASTNGLAAGNNLAEATRQALCEVNERDAMALFHTQTLLRDGVDAVIDQLGLPPATSRRPGPAFPKIEPTDIPPRTRRIYARLIAAGLKVFLRDITSATGIATIECSIAERTGPRRHRIHAGCGSHPDARVALRRAVIEAAQTRLTYIQGGREDLPLLPGLDPFTDPDRLFGGGQPRPFAEVATVEHADARDDVRWILGRMRAVGFRQAVAVDMTRPELGIPVVRVVVPLAECWSISRSHLGTAMIGPRALALLA